MKRGWFNHSHEHSLASRGISTADKNNSSSRVALNEAKIGHNWSERYRKVNGKKTLMKVRKTNNKIQLRKIGVRNYTDKTAKKMGRKRIKGFYNSTDKGNREHNIKRRSIF